MSRLSHTDLYLTFRDWSESDDDSDVGEYRPLAQNNTSINQTHVDFSSESNGASDITDSDQLSDTRIDSATNFAMLQNVNSHFQNIRPMGIVLDANMDPNSNVLNSESPNRSPDNFSGSALTTDHVATSNIRTYSEFTRLISQRSNFNRRERGVDMFNVLPVSPPSHDTPPVNDYHDSVLPINDHTIPVPTFGSLDPIDLRRLNNSLLNLDENRTSETRTGVSYGVSTFFRHHPEHEARYTIPLNMQKYGLQTLLDHLLIERSGSFNSTSNVCLTDKSRKRSYNQICLDDNNSIFLQNPAPKQPEVVKISPSSYLKMGSKFSLPLRLTGITASLSFTNVNYDNLDLSGYFQFGDTHLPFSGQLIDFIHNDLRLPENNVAVEGNIFSNLLRNKLIFSKRFEKYFDSKHHKDYAKENWKPFSLNKLGYIISNSNNATPFKTKTIIDPAKPSRFPNSSILHKCMATNTSKAESIRLLSKWFSMPPLNQFINTPSPPTPPNRKTHFANNPENLLVCKDCVNLIISKFLFLRLEIDLDDLFPDSNSKSSKIYPDFVYKHRRSCKIYSKKLLSKPNSNLRRHLNNENYRRLNLRTDGYGFSTENDVLMDSLNNMDSADDDDDDDDEHSSEKPHDDDKQLLENLAPHIYERTVDLSMDMDNEFAEFYNEDFQLMCADNDLEFENHPLLSRNLSNCSKDSDTRMNNFSEFNHSDHERTGEHNPRNIFSVWPLSNERNSYSTVRITDNNSENEAVDDDDDDNDDDDEYETDCSYDSDPSPYDFIFTGDRSNRVSRLLYNLNMVSRGDIHRRGPISVSELYKNNEAKKTKMVLLICINRNTGDLHLVPGNMDTHLWSGEKNNGELFQDVETFSKVFNLFLEDNNPSSIEGVYSKHIKDWIKKKRSKESEYIKKLMVLHLLTNPSIINGYNLRKEKVQKQIKTRITKNKLKREENRQGNISHDNNQRDEENLEKPPSLSTDNGRISEFQSIPDISDEMKNQLLSFFEETENLSVDNGSVITFKPGCDSKYPGIRRGGVSYAVEYV